MNKIKKIFGEIEMTWKKVILFAIIAGAYTAAVNLIPAFKNTSFRDIAVTTEWWVLFAVIIASNCKKPIESALKIFVFFLISQPLVYLIEMPFLGAGIWSYYKYWAIITILTLPGGFIAYFINKKNIIGALVLSAGLAIVAMNAGDYVLKLMVGFPQHLLTVIFCFVQIIVLIFAIIEQKGYRFLALLVSAVVFVGVLFMGFNRDTTIECGLPEGKNWVCTLEDESDASIINDDYSFTYTCKDIGKKDNTIHCVDESGKKATYKVKVEDNGTMNIVPQE